MSDPSPVPVPARYEDLRQQPIRVMFAGGGTGGHIFPALAVAQALRDACPAASIMFVGTEQGIEATVVPRAGFPFAVGLARGMSSHPLKAARSLFDNLRGTISAATLLKTFRPHVVVGSGGYVSLPLCMAARLGHTPMLLLEQNVVPGKVTQMFASAARVVCVSFDATIPRLRRPRRAEVTGNPVRQDILRRTRMEGRRALGIAEDAFCLLVTGASQGARTVNEAVVAALPAWKDRPWHVLHLVGKTDFESVRGRAVPLLEGAALRWDGRDFLDDMASAYAAADLVVARAGATTLAELTCRGLPSVLIPYPHAGAHQVENARWLEERGGAVMLRNEEAVGRLQECVAHLADDDERRLGMAAASQAAGLPQAADTIARLVVLTAHGVELPIPS